MYIDPFCPTQSATASFAPPMQLFHPYPMSRSEADLHWESKRQELRAHIATLSNSSFEKTKFEDDERFYATFPLARRAAIDHWIDQHFPDASWVQSPIAAYQGLIFDATYDLAQAPYVPTPIHAPTPTATFTTYTLADALKLPPSPVSKARIPPKTPTPTLPMVHYDYSDDAASRDTDNSPNSVITADMRFFGNEEHPREASPTVAGPLAPRKDDQVLHTLHLLAPARRSGKNTRRVHVHSSPYTHTPIPRAILSPTSSVSSCPTLETPPSSPTSSLSIPPNPIVVPSNASPIIQPRYTGDWEADAITAAEYLHSVVNIGKRPSVPISLPALPSLPIELPFCPTAHSSRHHHKHTHRHPSRQRRRPYSPPPRRSPSRRSPSREPSGSPLPPHRRVKMLRDKNGKPIMACLFCRGRKIACGPPPMGSDDPTCNQCARRGLECQYPTINRRGMRRKKPSTLAYDKVSAPSSPSSKRVSSAAFELVHIDKTIPISDYSDNSESEWDGDDY